jgi:hypothetical protein
MGLFSPEGRDEDASELALFGDHLHGTSSE